MVDNYRRQAGVAVACAATAYAFGADTAIAHDFSACGGDEVCFWSETNANSDPQGSYADRSSAWNGDANLHDTFYEHIHAGFADDMGNSLDLTWNRTNRYYAHYNHTSYSGFQGCAGPDKKINWENIGIDGTASSIRAVGISSC